MVEAASAYCVASTGAATSTVVASFNDDGAAVIVLAPATSGPTTAADVPSDNKSILPLPLSYADTGALLVATSSTVPTFNEGTAAVDSELLAVSAYCVTSGTGAVAVASDNTFIFSLSKDRAGKVLAAPSSTDDISLNDGVTVEVDSTVAACIGAGGVTAVVSDPTEASESCSIGAAVAATLSVDDASTGVLITLPWLSIVTSLGVDAASIAVSGTGAATAAAEEEESTPENSMAGAAAPTSSTPPPPPTTTPPSTSSTGTK
mmetsp:Transcript_5708/g.8392  ORF Transcript_5708/g.8392 Transcript_5708/m.8392 type:complete len:262 (-) Transcript_5708:1270-2055(-)